MNNNWLSLTVLLAAIAAGCSTRTAPPAEEPRSPAEDLEWPGEVNPETSFTVGYDAEDRGLVMERFQDAWDPRRDIAAIEKRARNFRPLGLSEEADVDVRFLNATTAMVYATDTAGDNIEAVIVFKRHNADWTLKQWYAILVE